MQNSFSSTITRNNFHSGNNVKYSQNTCEPKTQEIIRMALISELEAITEYENWATQITNETAKKILKEIRNEERIHAGELLTLLNILCPEETNFFNQGNEEVMKIIGNNTMNFKE